MKKPKTSSFSTVERKSELRANVDQWRRDGLTTAFVPTMGALHEGHLSLVRYANTVADRAVASIFVNPKQFAAHEDLDTYPRNHDVDLSLLKKKRL